MGPTVAAGGAGRVYAQVRGKPQSTPWGCDAAGSPTSTPQGILEGERARWRAVWQARNLISQRQPLLAVGFGGFASGPGGLAARLCKVPVVVHEQNAVPGLTNRLLSKMATVTLEGFQGAFGSQSACWVGNPVRAEIANLDDPARRYAQHQGGLRVLVLGGSQGALVLNQDLPELLLAVLGREIQVRHQCGAGRTGEAAPIYQALGMQARVSEFIDDMAEAYGWADLVICRACMPSAW